MSKFTPTMTWAIEQAIRAALEAQGSKYGSTMLEAVRDASIRECEKTNGEGGVKASTLVAALRIACANLDRVSQLETALHEIEKYGFHHDGCCPYGCDTPSIASRALHPETITK